MLSAYQLKVLFEDLKELDDLDGGSLDVIWHREVIKNLMLISESITTDEISVALDVRGCFKMEIFNVFRYSLFIGNEVGGFDSIDVFSEYISDELEYASVTFNCKNYVFSQSTLLELIDLLVAMSAVKRFSFSVFNAILEKLKISLLDIYIMQIKQTALELFRIKNGTHDEDSETVERISKRLKKEDPLFSKKLYKELEKAYPANA